MLRNLSYIVITEKYTESTRKCTQKNIHKKAVLNLTFQPFKFLKNYQGKILPFFQDFNKRRNVFKEEAFISLYRSFDSSINFQ